MKSIDIVTHCWSGPDVPIYHELLRLQLNSLASDPAEDVRVSIRICFSPSDELTRSVISAALDPLASVGVQVFPIGLSLRRLFRRAIGRNSAALRTQADAVWFTDCDHLFTSRCLRAAVREVERIEPDDPKQMRHPAEVAIHRSHDLGDVLIRRASRIPWGGLDLRDGESLVSDFAPRRERRAIGGLQIVRGDWARERGYLMETSWTDPVETDHFLSCHCDVPYRKSCGGSRAVEIPGLFRVRHTRAGRDRGEKDHGEKTRGG